MAEEAKAKVALGGVPETMLLTLYHRAIEARRPDALLHDPRAVALVDAIDYPFELRFGRGDLGSGQGQALRVRCFDQAVEDFLASHPDGTVVALGEGLETQFWRVDNGRVRWLTVDLPETVQVRRRLLPAEPRMRTLACSALDRRWMDEVDTSRGVLVTAQGLLMYLQPAEVHRLVAACAQRFAGGALLFDGVPRWLSSRTMRGMKMTEHYQVPPMPWAFDAAERRRLAATPKVVELRELRPPRGRGLFYGFLMPLVSRLPLLGGRIPPLLLWRIMLARFGPP
jgi:O-methyltransferase involved in polyketide biosynthesis